MLLGRETVFSFCARNKPIAGSFWAFLCFALLFHGALLFLPVSRQAPVLELPQAITSIQLHLADEMRGGPAEIEPQPPDLSKEAFGPRQVDDMVSRPPITSQAVQPETTEIKYSVSNENESLNTPAESSDSRLAKTTLASQFIGIQGQSDRQFDAAPFGQLGPPATEEFRFPVRTNMYALLEKPLPALPFDYESNSIRFSYDPGLLGNMQRFWDAITPEFAFRTDGGTEVGCVVMIVIIGCGWE